MVAASLLSIDVINDYPQPAGVPAPAQHAAAPAAGGEPPS